MSSRKIFSVVIGILLIIAGISCFFSPAQTSTIIPFLAGIVLAVIGLGKVIAWFDLESMLPMSGWPMLSAAVTLIIGLLLMFSNRFQIATSTVIIALIGIWIAVLGIIRLVHASRLHKAQKQGYSSDPDIDLRENWKTAFIPGLLLTIFGILLVCNPFIGFSIISIVIGLSIILAGASMIFFGSDFWAVW